MISWNFKIYYKYIHTYISKTKEREQNEIQFTSGLVFLEFSLWFSAKALFFSGDTPFSLIFGFATSFDKFPLAEIVDS